MQGGWGFVNVSDLKVDPDNGGGKQTCKNKLMLWPEKAVCPTGFINKLELLFKCLICDHHSSLKIHKNVMLMISHHPGCRWIRSNFQVDLRHLHPPRSLRELRYLNPPKTGLLIVASPVPMWHSGKAGCRKSCLLAGVSNLVGWLYCYLWWFQILFIFTPNLGEMPN